MSAISRLSGASVCFECKPGCERSPYSERLVFERRGATRSPVEGRAMAAFTDPSGAVSIAYVDLIDESAEGLGIACAIDVAVGSSVTLYNLPRSTSEKGTVVRSQRGAGVSRIGCRVSYSRVAA